MMTSTLTYTASESVDSDIFRIIREQLDKSLEHYEDTMSNMLSNPAIKFNILKNQWLSETSHLSSITSIAMHPDYQKIIGMGEIAIPLILNEMKVRPNHWFWALKSITDEDPVPPEYCGKIKKMTESWLEWGKKQGHLF